MRQQTASRRLPDEADRAAGCVHHRHRQRPMAAVVGFQSPLNDQRAA